MKSTIKVELGPQNQPVIRMRVYPTDDVRDILFVQFKEAFGHQSDLCSVSFESGSFLFSDGMTCIMEISPLSPNSHHICHQRVKEIYRGICFPYEDSVSDITMVTGGGTIGFYKGVNGPGIELNRDDLRSLNIVELVRIVTDTINRVIGPVSSTNKENNLPSKYQIEDEVVTSDGIFDGKVVAVKFTAGKVYYDILDKLTGKVVENVDSALVQGTSPVKIAQL